MTNFHYLSFFLAVFWQLVQNFWVFCNVSCETICWRLRIVYKTEILLKIGELQFQNEKPVVCLRLPTEKKRNLISLQVINIILFLHGRSGHFVHAWSKQVFFNRGLTERIPDLKMHVLQI